MKIKISLITITILIIMACSTSKKSTTSTVAATPVTPTATVEATPVVIAKPANGIYEPGNDELVAMQAQDKTVTLEKLKAGYILYAKSACISCHEAQNIHNYDNMRWGFIIDNMAAKARLNPEQKSAVRDYVFAIKAAKTTK